MPEMGNSAVIFNEAGRSIESPCSICRDGKWKEAYLLCSQPSDVLNVVLFGYKSRKHRLRRKESFVLTLDTLVGIESGFELLKKRFTLCVITRNDILITSYASVEELVLWESWIGQTCCRGMMFFAQLVDAPEGSRARCSLNREVRIHVHDGRFAIVTGRPQKMLGYWKITEILRVGFSTNRMFFFAYNNRRDGDNGMFSIACGQIRELKESFENAKRPGRLLAYLRWKSGDGFWLERTRILGPASIYPDQQTLRSRLSCAPDSTRHICGSRADNLFVCQADVHSRPLVRGKSASTSREPESSLGSRDMSDDLSATKAVTSNGSGPRYCPNYENVHYEKHDDEVQASWISVDPDAIYMSRLARCAPHYVNVCTPERPYHYDSAAAPEVSTANSAYLGDLSARQRQSPVIIVNHNYENAVANDWGGHWNAPPASSVGGSRTQTGSEFSIPQPEAASKAADDPAAEQDRSSATPDVSSAKQSVYRAGSWPKHVCSARDNSAISRQMSMGNIGSYNSRTLQALEVANAQRHSQKQLSNGTSEVKGKYVRQHQKLSRARGRDPTCMRDRKTARVHQRSRSVGLEASVPRSGTTPEEKWDRAKRIIGGVRRSINGVRSTGSSSLDKLAILPAGGLSSGGVSSQFGLAGEHSTPNEADKFPRLDVPVNADTSAGTAGPFTCAQPSNPIPGLVKPPPEKFTLLRVGNILTKSLRKSVTGSYSKYDGERATHHYNPEDGPQDMPPIVDCIGSAVKKGRARLSEADRRNSGFADGLHVASGHPVVVRLPRTAQPPGVASGRRGSATSSSTASHSNPVKIESGAESDIGSLRSHAVSSTSVNKTGLIRRLDTVRNAAAVESLPVASPTTSSSEAPPLPPRTYLKKKKASKASVTPDMDVPTDVQVNVNASSIADASTSQPLSGNYCDVVASSAPSRKISGEGSKTIYMQIDPVATMAAMKVQEEMMKSRELGSFNVGHSAAAAKFSSDKGLFERKKSRRNSDETSGLSANRGGFFSRRLFKKTSSSFSHSDLLF